MTLLLFVWLWDAKNDDVKVNLSILSTQALHKISLRESVCTVRVCEVLLSLASTLIDLGVLANNAKALLLSSLVNSDNNKQAEPDGMALVGSVQGRPFQSESLNPGHSMQVCRDRPNQAAHGLAWILK